MSMFNRRHHEAIAAVIRGNVTHDRTYTGAQLVALDLAELFEQDNQNFERKCFEIACGLREEKS